VKPQSRKYRPAVQTDTFRPVCFLIRATTASRVQRAKGSFNWSCQPPWMARTIFFFCFRAIVLAFGRPRCLALSATSPPLQQFPVFDISAEMHAILILLLVNAAVKIFV